ncbi:hypothetical protein CPB84DRAFT_1792308 [Gymnopilus junonius]|uniref:Uncharacterized protein n=1 Tax=Gymnopilus junonius TaxID=109634 RepID=A0A9P5NDS3_GYMJU|nr:hypothetical protein CPB84DRAFT_1792308 [Gymnopilus junonius]
MHAIMSIRALTISALLSGYLVSPAQAATITLFAPGRNSIIGISAIDVLPGNITEYAVGMAVTSFSEVTGPTTSVSASTTTVSVTIQEGASFFGTSLNFFEVSGTQTTLETPVAAVDGCTPTVPVSATETEFHCTQVQVFNGTETLIFSYTEADVPFYTLTESTPPPTASATTNVPSPTGTPITNGSKQLRSGSRVVLVLVVLCSVAFI